MVKRMTLGQEVTLMHGVGPGTPSGTVGATEAIPSLGIPAINQQDGPGGIGDGASGVTQLPAPEALAATFDPNAARCYGQVIGTEARGKGVNLVYGPTVNIVRVPQWGRAFESLGEDPTLTGTIASAEVGGIQRSGTMAQIKHFSVYNQETDRLSPSDDSIVSEQALQEVYLRAWDQIVRAEPSSVMCSYNSINGSGACEDGDLIRGYLDRTLRFPGFVGSDYYATHSTAASVNAGLDQEQPLSLYLGSALETDLMNGRVSRATVDQAVIRILTQMYRFWLTRADTKRSIRDNVASAADARVSGDVAVEGTTLLKNSGRILPLDTTARGGIAVIGPAAQTSPITVGGGSAMVTPSHMVTPLAGIRAGVGTKRPVTFTSGLPASGDFVAIPSPNLSAPYPTLGDPSLASATLTAPQTGTYEIAYREPADFVPRTLSLDGTPVVTNPGTLPRPVYTATVTLTAGQTYTLSGPVQDLTWVLPNQIAHDIAEATSAASRASTAVVVVGDGQESEGADRVSLSLPSNQDNLVSAVASVNPHTIVVIDAGGPVLMPWLSEVSAVLDAWYPGQTDGTSLAAVLLGKANPSGHLPITFPATAMDDPVSTPAQYPGVGTQVRYSEGIDVGYRWYDATGTTPLFPFGFGLSYTAFRYSSPTLHVSTAHGNPTVTATVRVENAGHREGADVAQLYLGQPAVAGNPPRQLEAFQRVSLAAGESRTITFTLRGRQLGYYDAGAGSWLIAAGTYQIWMGDSSALAQLPARVEFHLSRTR